MAAAIAIIIVAAAFTVLGVVFYVVSKREPFEKGWWIPGSGFYFYFRESK